MNPIEWFKRRARGPIKDESFLAVRSAAAEAQRSRMPQMAAALSFRTLFGLIPVLVVGLLVANRFMDREQRVEVIQRAVEFAGLGNIKVGVSTIPSADSSRRSGHGSSGSPSRTETEPKRGASAPKEGSTDAAAGSPTAAPKGAEAPTGGAERANRPDTTEEKPGGTTTNAEPKERGIADEIAGLVTSASTSRAIGAVGIVGLITLIYAAVSMLVEIERAFNQIFRVPRGRSWWRRVVNYWTLLTLGGIGLAGTLYVGAKFQIEAKGLVEARGIGSESGTVLLSVLGYCVTVMISTALLTMVYAVVPNTRVRPLAALVGGFIGALLWEAGKWAFGEYVAYSTGYAKLYGSLALIPLFMLWVYYTWLIVLFGLMVVYQFQFGRLKMRPEPLSDFGPTIVEPTAGLVVMTAMARAMSAGTPQSVKALAQTTGIAEAVASLVVNRFTQRGLLLRVERDEEGAEPLYALARTPGSIRVGEVLAIGFELAGGPESNPVVERMRKAQVTAAGSETLADIAGTPGDGGPRPGNTAGPQAAETPPPPATPGAPATDRPEIAARAGRR
jgi:membrane protein